MLGEVRIFGQEAVRSGTVWRAGEAVVIRHPAEAVRRGIGYLPEERKTQGLFLEQSVSQNIVAVRPPARGAWFRAGLAREVAETFRQRLGIRTPSVGERVGNLSGGNQQKTVLARWLLCDPTSPPRCLTKKSLEHGQ